MNTKSSSSIDPISSPPSTQETAQTVECPECGGDGCHIEPGDPIQTGAHSVSYEGGGTSPCRTCNGSGTIRKPDPAQETGEALDRRVREALWVNHGCPFPALYGDDGELQCNDIGCRLDFKREPLPSLLLKLIAAGRLHAGKVSEPRDLAKRIIRGLVSLTEEQPFAYLDSNVCEDFVAHQLIKPAAAEPLITALREYGQHKPTCLINVTRHADDSAAYLSEKCTCGFDQALAGSGEQQRTKTVGS